MGHFPVYFHFFSMTDYFLSEFTGWFDFLYSSFTLVTKSYLYKPCIRQTTTTFLKKGGGGGGRRKIPLCVSKSKQQKEETFIPSHESGKAGYCTASLPEFELQTRRTWPGRVLPCNRWSIWINVSITGSQSYNLRSCDSDDVRCFSCCSSSSSQPCTSAKT